MSATLQALVEHDKALAVLRESLRNAPLHKKAHWMSRIDQALDERLKLMKARDEEKLSAKERLADIAPELLDSLEETIAALEIQFAAAHPDYDPEQVKPDSIIGRARAVIAKATGKDGAE